MAFSFGKKYNYERQFTRVDTDALSGNYKSLEDLLADVGGDLSFVFPLYGLYLNTKSKFSEEAPVAATETCYVNLPEHMLPVVKDVLRDNQAVAAINAGKVGFTIYKYYQKTYNKECYGIKWVDM